MKAKFIRKGKKTYFQDRNGAMWSEECIDELFGMVHAFNRFFERVQYYKRERIDHKNFYENKD